MALMAVYMSRVATMSSELGNRVPDNFGTPWQVIGPDFISTIIEGADGMITRTDPDLEFALQKPFGWFRRFCELKQWRLEK